MGRVAWRGGLKGWWRKQSARRKKQAWYWAGVAAVVVGTACFSVLCGDALWQGTLASARRYNAEATAVPQALPTATAVPVAAPALGEPDVAVWIPWSGTRYHSDAACSGMQDAREVSLYEARALGLEPCKRCSPPE